MIEANLETMYGTRCKISITRNNLLEISLWQMLEASDEID